jgi:hypothetical protein
MKPKKRHCVHGHDTSIGGRGKTGNCLMCRQRSFQRWYDKKHPDKTQRTARIRLRKQAILDGDPDPITEPFDDSSVENVLPSLFKVGL